MRRRVRSRRGAGGGMISMARILFRRYPVLAACAALGVLASFVILAQRYTLERAYHTVEITADGDDWTTLARRDGVDLDTLYRALYQRGVRSVTLYAASLTRLSDDGRLAFMTGADVVNAERVGSARRAARGHGPSRAAFAPTARTCSVRHRC